MGADPLQGKGGGRDGCEELTVVELRESGEGREGGRKGGREEGFEARGV